MLRATLCTVRSDWKSDNDHITRKEAIKLSSSTGFWREDSTTGRGARPETTSREQCPPQPRQSPCPDQNGPRVPSPWTLQSMCSVAGRASCGLQGCCPDPGPPPTVRGEGPLSWRSTFFLWVRRTE
ncbi:hypothetical protein LEMLEM_LOCUS17397 [Lemmus lemmus]